MGAVTAKSGVTAAEGETRLNEAGPASRRAGFVLQATLGMARVIAAMKWPRASRNDNPRGSSTWRVRKYPVNAKPSARSALAGAIDASCKNAGNRKSLSCQGSPAARETARPDFGET